MGATSWLEHSSLQEKSVTEEDEAEERLIGKASGGPLFDVSPPRGAGGYAGVGGGTYCPPPLSNKKKTPADGGGIEVLSQDEALEEAAVGTVGERGGRPGPHPKPSKGWDPSGACMRRVPMGLVGCLGRVRGETEGGAGGR